MFPNNYDNDRTLFLVKDSLRTYLGQDYLPGDKVIYASEDISNFPETGIITVLDQQNKATSFYYSGISNNYFYGLELLEDSIDEFKSKDTSIITQQVMSNHREVIKNSIIEIEKTIGMSKDINKNNIYSKINNLKKTIYQPKAWFEASITKGTVPLTVNFRNLSNGIVGDVNYLWDFGDNTTETIQNPEKTFNKGGKYTVTLKITNEYGEDTISYQDMIQVIEKIPDEAKITFDNKKYCIGDVIDVKITNKGPNKYTWKLDDDLTHDSINTKVSYGTGGLKDLIVKVENSQGGFRVTKNKEALNIIEENNLYLWIKKENNIYAYEYGLLSQSFKRQAMPPLIAKGNNNGFAKLNSASSGKGGTCTLYWGEEDIIKFSEFNAFTESYFTPCPNIERPQNWISFASKDSIYFFLGNTEKPNINNQNKTTISLSGYFKNEERFHRFSYSNGAEELQFGKHQFKTTWLNDVGYLLSDFKQFYKTDGILGSPFNGIVKLGDAPDQKDGEIIGVGNYIYLLSSNSKKYNTNVGIWEDLDIDFENPFIGYEDKGNIYLSFEDNKFAKLQSFTNSLTYLNDRPNGKQWLIGIF